MKSCEVVLIHPQIGVFDIGLEAETSVVLPLGLAYVAASLQKHGITVHIIDMVAERFTVEDVVRRVKELSPRVVGISVCTVAQLRAVEVARALKASRPELKVVFGGPHPTVDYRRLLQEESIDVAVRGEGEETMPELVEAFHAGADLAAVRGIAFRRDSEVVATPRRPFIKDLDALPLPAVSLLTPLSRYWVYPVSTGRGCTYKCTFCAAGVLSGRTYRVRSAPGILEEVKQASETYGINNFFFVDDTFTAIPERTFEICRMLESEAPGIHWVCECRTNTVSRALLASMVRAGCFKLQFGIESGNQRILNRVQKGTTLAQIERAVRDAFEAGISDVVGSFIIGLPGETKETVLETVALALKLRGVATDASRRYGRPHVFTPFFASLIPFPHTGVSDDADELGITVLRDDPLAFIGDDIFSHPKAIHPKEIRELVLVAELIVQNLSLPGFAVQESIQREVTTLGAA